MDEQAIIQYITDTFAGVQLVDAWGDVFFYYNPDPEQENEFYFATLKSSDDEYDNVSDLNRPSVFRLNIGISKDSYLSMFEKQPYERGAEKITDTSHDFTVLDELLPHPVYGRMYWVCVLNPSARMFEEAVRPLLTEAYDLAVSKYKKKNDK